MVTGFVVGLFFSQKDILIYAVGWGYLLLGVVIGALKPPDPMLMERRIPTLSFQPPNFQNKKYLDDAYEFHELKYFVYADKVWAVWQYMEKPVAGHFSNVFCFRTFDGKVWTETRN